jgi:hypothetical protein
MTKLSYIGIKEDNKPFRIVNTAFFKIALNSLPKGRYTIVVEKYRKHKSNPQLAYLFAVVYPKFREFALKQGWEFDSIDEVDLYLKDMFAGKEITNRHTGEIITIPALKRDFNTIDMMTYINKIRDYVAEYWGEYIPEPLEQLTMPLDENPRP